MVTNDKSNGLQKNPVREGGGGGGGGGRGNMVCQNAGTTKLKINYIY